MRVWPATSRGWGVLIVLLCLLVFLIRITGPSDLEGYAQHRNIGYVMDMMWGGNWLAQHDIQGRILSKPPLHSWTIAPFAAIFGVDRLAMSRVRSRAFVLGTLLGFLPQGVVAVLLGAGIADEVAWQGAVQLVAAALIVLLLFVFALLRRRSEGAR